MGAINCWEHMKCGREPGGKNIEELGVCPATIEKKLDGRNRGKNAGRACWIVAGTMCLGETQGTNVDKNANCAKCEFYILVRKEEGRGFEGDADLMRHLQE